MFLCEWHFWLLLGGSASRVRGLNKECSAHLFGGLDGPLRKEIDVSLCHGILCMCSAGLGSSSSGLGDDDDDDGDDDDDDDDDCAGYDD